LLISLIIPGQAMFKKIIYLFVIAIIITSCNINSSIMLKTKKDYQYAEFPTEPPREYRMSANDIFTFQMYSNDGFKLVDVTGPENSSRIGATQNVINYLVEFDGYAKLPILGRISMKGLTIREAENMLEEKYAAFYNKPFVMLNVINKRIIVFPGASGVVGGGGSGGSSGGSARVINLVNNNTTLLEALALAGGIQVTGKSKKIKLIRGDLKNPNVYLIDLSTIDGIKKADIIMQNGDIIYVEPIPNYAGGVVSQLAPYLSLLSSTLLVFTVIQQLSSK
jgi:polysaccharide export outer membrane protein